MDEQRLIRNLLAEMTRRDIDKKEMANKMDMDVSTFNRKVRTGKFTLVEFASGVNWMMVPDSEIIK